MTLTLEVNSSLKKETLENVRTHLRRAFENNQACLHGGEVLRDRLLAGDVTIADLQKVASDFTNADQSVTLQYGDHLVIRVPAVGLMKHLDKVRTLADVAELLINDPELRKQSILFPSDNLLFVLDSPGIQKARREAERHARH